MAFQWFKKWPKCRAKQDSRLSRAWEVQVASSKAHAAVRRNTTYAGSLYQVPEDLLYMICQYLSDSETVVLTLSCSGFWGSRRRNGVLGGAWNRMTLSDEEELCRMEARFYVLRMLEYDGLFQRGSSESHCCWGCMKTHEKQVFSDEEFDKKVDLKAKAKDYGYLEEKARFCDLSKRYIWLGTCREMSFAELRHIIAHPQAQQQQDQQQ